MAAAVFLYRVRVKCPGGGELAYDNKKFVITHREFMAPHLASPAHFT